MIDNTNKTALIFGIRNDSSLAFGVAKKLHLSGCSVALSYLPETEKSVKSLLQDNDIDTELTSCVDVRHDKEIKDFVEGVHKKTGSIDYILHAVAAADSKVICKKEMSKNEKQAEYIDIPFDELVDSFNVSSYSLLRICRIAEPYLSEGASVLALTHNASQKVFPGYAGMAINKAALENIVIYLANYFRKNKIRVNAISSGLVMTSSTGWLKGIRRFRKISKHTAPLGNVGPDDIGDTALYYFSSLSEKVTGNIHYVDGGYNIMGISNDGT